MATSAGNNVPAAMVNNQFFDEFTDKVRVKPIPWEGFSRAGVISSEELDELKKFQQLYSHQAGGEELARYVPLLVGLAGRLTSLDALQYLVVVLDDAVEGMGGDAAVRALAASDEAEKALFRCMERKDDYLGLKAAKVLVAVVVETGGALAEQFSFQRLFRGLERFMGSELASVADVALQVVQSALRVARARYVLYQETPGCLELMLAALRRTMAPGSRARGVVAVPQTQYEVVFCLWLLTFERSIAASLDRKHDVVPLLVDIARSAAKEKVVRVVVATWGNMLKDPGANVTRMLAAHVAQCLQTLATGRNFKDEDLRADVRALAEELQAHSGVLTTWDEYCNEVAAGRLRWSPAHRSEQFWKMHVRRMDEDDHRVVRQLGDVLGTSDDDTALAVACHDLAQYVRFNPDGKRLLARIGAKTRVMALMTSENAEVRYEALMCVQQIMLNAWRN
ncbi:H(+)-transporting V1 sector ATPase subunit H [Coemansia sp. Benny D115]|nr:H(+)-transporting V1 sector ATPase subunit H [Coemansia sp. Benny D115]